MPIRGIAFEGDGIKSLSHLGVCEVLDEHNLLDYLTHFSGSSTGAIMATALAFKIKTEKLREQVLKITPSNIEDDTYFITKLYNLHSKYGLNKGENLHKWVKDLFLPFVPNFLTITFDELLKSHNSFLIITATDYHDLKPFYFSPDNTPHAKIFDALKATLSIHLYFTPLLLNNKLLIDGSLIDSYPVEILYKYLDKHDIIGVSFNKENDHKLENRNLFNYINGLIKLLHFQIVNKNLTKKILKHTIIIHTEKIEPYDIYISDKQKKSLYNSGRIATEKFLKDFLLS